MAQKKVTQIAPGEEWTKTSLKIRAKVYRRAWDYKLDKKGRDLGEIVSEALDEYLKARGA